MTEPNRYSVEEQADGTHAVFNNGGFVKGFGKHERYMALSYARDLAGEDEKAGVPVAPRYTYIVKGRWPFPADMLRKDQSAGADANEADVITRMINDVSDDTIGMTVTTIALAGPSLPNVGRWNSFGWQVTSITESNGREVDIFPPVENQKVSFVKQEKKFVGTIDLTPTWTGLMPALIAALQDGTPTGQQIAKEEIMRAAALLDQYVARDKNKEG